MSLDADPSFGCHGGPWDSVPDRMRSGCRGPVRTREWGHGIALPAGTVVEEINGRINLYRLVTEGRTHFDVRRVLRLALAVHAFSDFDGSDDQ